MLSALTNAWQSWMGARGVAALAATAFAVGIGCATAIYTVIHGVMLRPLPYAHDDRFVALFGTRSTEPGQRSSHNFPDLIEYQNRTRSFDVFGWLRPSSFNVSYAGQSLHVNGVLVTPALARGLGVNPLVGQWFVDDREAVISSSLWKRLGADPNIVSKLLTVDGNSLTITGVMPPAFRFPGAGPGVGSGQSDLWIGLDPLGKGQDRSLGMYFGYARLKPDVTFQQADADVKRAAAEIAALDPAAHPSYSARVDGVREAAVLEIKPTLILLAAAAGLLLLLTCADVAGLLLARAVARARDTAIRVALGATRRQLALHYVLEGLIVSIAGAAAGIVVRLVLVRVVLSMASEYIPRADEVRIDWTVLVFALGAAGVASGLASLAPLWQAVRTTPAEVLNEGVRATAGARSRRVSRSLVAGEIALA